MMGEAGEVCNAWKKADRHRNRIGGLLTEKSVQAMGEELVDTLVYAFNVARVLGIDLEVMYDYKRRVNEQRFGSRGTEGVEDRPA